MSGMRDQAEGLRRMLTAGRTRVVAVAALSRAVGATTTVTNLAVELARTGQSVLVLDERPTAANSACALAPAPATGTLADVAARRIRLSDASAAIAGGAVRILAAPSCPAAFNVRSLCPDGIVLVDTVLGADGQLSGLATCADDIVLVMQPTAASITATYAGLKQLQFAHALQTFRFLVNEALNEHQARVVIENIEATSSRYLAVGLQALGWVPHDILVRESGRLRKAVCEAYTTCAASSAFRRAAAALMQPAAADMGSPAAQPSRPAALARAA